MSLPGPADMIRTNHSSLESKLIRLGSTGNTRRPPGFRVSTNLLRITVRRHRLPSLPRAICTSGDWRTMLNPRMSVSPFRCSSRIPINGWFLNVKGCTFRELHLTRRTPGHTQGIPGLRLASRTPHHGLGWPTSLRPGRSFRGHASTLISIPVTACSGTTMARSPTRAHGPTWMPSPSCRVGSGGLTPKVPDHRLISTTARPNSVEASTASR